MPTSIARLLAHAAILLTASLLLGTNARATTHGQIPSSFSPTYLSAHGGEPSDSSAPKGKWVTSVFVGDDGENVPVDLELRVKAPNGEWTKVKCAAGMLVIPMDTAWKQSDSLVIVARNQRFGTPKFVSNYEEGEWHLALSQPQNNLFTIGYSRHYRPGKTQRSRGCPKF